jgi:ketosteroid isomerase-like protein
MAETDFGNWAPHSASEPTLFAAFISAVASGDLISAETMLADDIEWDMMPTGQHLSGKAEVMPWLQAGAASRKEPATISDLAARDWGVFEYWNIGVVTEELVAFGNRQNWPWPKDPNSLIGQKYKVAQCFVWRLNASGKIRLMRQYLDTGSV